MKIEGIIWLRDVVDKLWYRHHVEIEEVEEVLCVNPNTDLLKKGIVKAKMYIWLWDGPLRGDIYLCFSSTR